MAGKLALLFPGHGAHEPNMLSGLMAHGRFDEYYSVIAEALGYDPLDAIKRDPSLINGHFLSTMFTLLSSSLSYLTFLRLEKRDADYLAGYSIGQFTALHAAGCYEFKHLVELIRVRSSIIDRCLEKTPGAMLGVVGIMLDPINEIVNELQADGHRVYISNFNCAGQYSLSGTPQAIKAAMEAIAPLKPKRLIELPVAGAWHCPLLDDAKDEIADHVRRSHWNMPRIPVIDNVTGDFLPADINGIKEQVIMQVTHPVRWDAGIRTLLSHGCSNFVEVGYGNVLTKFGFFIDRSADFSSFFAGETLVQPRT